MVGKNDIIGDLEKLNDIINYIIFIIGRKMISFFSSSLAGHTTAHRSPPSDELCYASWMFLGPNGLVR
jgi:hypothetical protein